MLKGRDIIKYSKNLGMGLDCVAANPLFQKMIFGPNSTFVWSPNTKFNFGVVAVHQSSCVARFLRTLKFNSRLLGIRSFLLFVFVFLFVISRFLRIEIQFSAFALFFGQQLCRVLPREISRKFVKNLIDFLPHIAPCCNF